MDATGGAGPAVAQIGALPKPTPSIGSRAPRALVGPCDGSELYPAISERLAESKHLSQLEAPQAAMCQKLKAPTVITPVFPLLTQD